MTTDTVAFHRFAAILLVVFGGYLVSLRIHPLRKCQVCKMTGRHFGSAFMNSYRRCRRCGGTGCVERLGARDFFGGTTQAEVPPKK